MVALWGSAAGSAGLTIQPLSPSLFILLSLMFPLLLHICASTGQR